MAKGSRHKAKPSSQKSPHQSPNQFNEAGLWHFIPLHTGSRYLNWLLLLSPIVFVAHYALSLPPLLMFALAGLAIVPLAAALGESTNAVAEHTSQSVGGLLNATMGNAAELIISLIALLKDHVQVVKASLSGSIIGNALLVLGFCAFAGGIGREKQTFSRQNVMINSTMLFVVIVALVMPAVYDLTVFGSLKQNSPGLEHLSLATAAVLILMYALSLVFSFVTHQTAPTEPPSQGKTGVSMQRAIFGLAIAAALIALLSDILVGEIESAKQALGISDLFMGVIIIAVIGNAAEHSTAVTAARRDQMDLSLSIAAGSSSQIALFVAPVLVFVGYLTGHPMSLIFSPLEIAGIVLAVVVMALIATDGETTWFEGAALLAVYAILALSFYFVPSGS
jgi:Ca2+:H+ antiporter